MFPLHLATIMSRTPADSEKTLTFPTEITEPLSDTESQFPRDATEDEMRTLPRVVDRIPLAAWAAALIGAAERFSYYAIISIWRKQVPHSL